MPNLGKSPFLLIVTIPCLRHLGGGYGSARMRPERRPSGRNAWAAHALEHVAMMKQSINHGPDGRDTGQQFSPVVCFRFPF
jgi:hypothetical protein